MQLTEKELHTLLKGLNMISGTNETKLSQLEIFELQQRLEKCCKEAE